MMPGLIDKSFLQNELNKSMPKFGDISPRGQILKELDDPVVLKSVLDEPLPDFSSKYEEDFSDDDENYYDVDGSEATGDSDDQAQAERLQSDSQSTEGVPPSETLLDNMTSRLKTGLAKILGPATGESETDDLEEKNTGTSSKHIPPPFSETGDNGMDTSKLPPPPPILLQNSKKKQQLYMDASNVQRQSQSVKVAPISDKTDEAKSDDFILVMLVNKGKLPSTPRALVFPFGRYSNDDVRLSDFSETPFGENVSAQNCLSFDTADGFQKFLEEFPRLDKNSQTKLESLECLKSNTFVIVKKSKKAAAGSPPTLVLFAPEKGSSERTLKDAKIKSFKEESAFGYFSKGLEKGLQSFKCISYLDCTSFNSKGKVTTVEEVKKLLSKERPKLEMP